MRWRLICCRADAVVGQDVSRASCRDREPVVAVGGRPVLVHAALLHATYTSGEFGDGQRNAAESKRAAVRAVIGAEAEELVAGYATLGYSADTIRDWQQRAHILSSLEHDLAVLRLANEVDEHIDLGTRYSDRHGHPMSSDSVFLDMIVLADELDEPALADLMDRIRIGEAEVLVPVVLRSRAKWTRGHCAPVVLASPGIWDPAGEARGPQTGCSHSTTVAGSVCRQHGAVRNAVSGSTSR